MRSVTDLKSLGDIRTGISAHARSSPRLKGSTYLEVYLLDKEKQRLETELTMLAKRQLRVEARVAEIRKAVQEQISQVEEGAAAAAGGASVARSVDRGESPAPGPPSGRSWRKLRVSY